MFGGMCVGVCVVMCVCVCVCVCVCPFDYSHTVQPRALKFWDMIPRVIF